VTQTDVNRMLAYSGGGAARTPGFHSHRRDRPERGRGLASSCFYLFALRVQHLSAHRGSRLWVVRNTATCEEDTRKNPHSPGGRRPWVGVSVVRRYFRVSCWPSPYPPCEWVSSASVVGVPGAGEGRAIPCLLLSALNRQRIAAYFYVRVDRVNVLFTEPPESDAPAVVGPRADHGRLTIPGSVTIRRGPPPAGPQPLLALANERTAKPFPPCFP